MPMTNILKYPFSIIYRSAQSAIRYEFEEFETQQLQKYGLVNVWIKPRVTAAVVARINQISQNNIYFSRESLRFRERSSEYESLRRNINSAIRRRAIEVAEQIIAETSKLDNEYVVVVDLDERTEKLLQRAYNAFIIEKELNSIYHSEIIPRLDNIGNLKADDLYLPQGMAVRENLAKAIDELQQLDNVDDAKRRFRELASKLIEEHMESTIRWLVNRVNKLAEEKKQLYDELKTLKEKITDKK